MSMTQSDNDENDVDTVLDLLLDRSGLRPIAADRDALTTALATATDHRALVHAVTTARYAEPGLVFSARPGK